MVGEHVLRRVTPYTIHFPPVSVSLFSFIMFLFFSPPCFCLLMSSREGGSLSSSRPCVIMLLSIFPLIWFLSSLRGLVCFLCH